MFKFNGQTPNKILFNGKNVARVLYRTFSVWVDKILKTLTTDSGNIRAVRLEHAIAEPITETKVFGHGYQSSTPTPEAPVEISTTGVLDSATGKYKIPCFVGSNKVIANYDAIPTSYTTSSGYITREGSTIIATNTTTSTAAIGLEVAVKDIFPELKIGDVIMFDMKTNGIDHIWLRYPGLVEKGGIFTITQNILNSPIHLYTQYSGTLTATITELSYYKTIKDYNVLLDEPLRRYYNDTYCDYIDFVNKKVVRNCGSLVLTGNEPNWIDNGNYTTDTVMCVTNMKINNYVQYHSSYTGGLCNKLKYNANSKVQNTFRFSSDMYLFLSFDKSKYANLEAAREIIAGTEIIYIRQTPIEEPIDVDDIILEEGDNMISVFYNHDSAPLIKKITISYYGLNN